MLRHVCKASPPDPSTLSSGAFSERSLVSLPRALPAQRRGGRTGRGFLRAWSCPGPGRALPPSAGLVSALQPGLCPLSAGVCSLPSAELICPLSRGSPALPSAEASSPSLPPQPFPPSAGALSSLSRGFLSPSSPQPGLCALSRVFFSLSLSLSRFSPQPHSLCPQGLFSPHGFLPPQAARGRCPPGARTLPLLTWPPHPLRRVPASTTRRAPGAHARPRPFPPPSAGGSRESAVISLLRAVPCCSWRRWSGGAELLG